MSISHTSVTTSLPNELILSNTRWLAEADTELLRDWIAHSDQPLLVSLPPGPDYAARIVWCNKAFERFIKYSHIELVGHDGQPGISWTKLSVDDLDLEADVVLAQELLQGDITEYSIEKSYRPKNSLPEKVKVHVLRYPRYGEFRCFLVTVTPLGDHHTYVTDLVQSHLTSNTSELSELRAVLKEVLGKQTEVIEQQTTTLERVVTNNTAMLENCRVILQEIKDDKESPPVVKAVTYFALFCIQYPTVTGIAAMTLLVMVLGTQVIQSLTAVLSLFAPNLPKGP